MGMSTLSNVEELEKLGKATWKGILKESYNG